MAPRAPGRFAIERERKSTRACALPDLELMTASLPPANRRFDREIAGRPTRQQEAAQLAQQAAAQHVALQRAQQHATQQAALQAAAQYVQAERERQQPLFTLNRPTYMNSRAPAVDGALQQVIDALPPPPATAAPSMQPPAASSRVMRAFDTLLSGWGNR